MVFQDLRILSVVPVKEEQHKIFYGQWKEDCRESIRMIADAIENKKLNANVGYRKYILQIVTATMFEDEIKEELSHYLSRLPRGHIKNHVNKFRSSLTRMYMFHTWFFNCYSKIVQSLPVPVTTESSEYRIVQVMGRNTKNSTRAIRYKLEERFIDGNKRCIKHYDTIEEAENKKMMYEQLRDEKHIRDLIDNDLRKSFSGE